MNFCKASAERWIEVCDADKLASKMLPVRVEDAELILIHHDGRLLACERACPHEQADLLRGHIVEGRLFCPHHAASFDLNNGEVSHGWTCRPLRIYDVRIAGGKIWVDMSTTRCAASPSRIADMTAT